MFNKLFGTQPSKEDLDIIECGEYVIENTTSANTTNRIKWKLNEDIREQWKTGQILDLRDEVELAKMGPRRN